MWKKLRIAKRYGEWEYNKTTPKEDGELDGPIYEFKRVDELKDKVEFAGGVLGIYEDMIYVIKSPLEQQEKIYEHIE